MQIRSRTTTARAFADYFWEPASNYNEVSTFTGVGVHSVTLRGFHKHYSSVSSSLIEARFEGHAEHPSGSTIFDNDTMDVRFSVTGAPATVNLSLSGRAFRGSLKPSTPTNINAYFLIYNADTNALVFDSWNIGVAQGSLPSDYRVWSNSVWSSELAIGNYKVLMRASGDVTEHVGPGFPASGWGNLNATMTIVPAPGSVLALGAAAILSSRRRSRTMN
ncbi:MAG: PEP-CTERM sorting domain-containing protein [Planctomycetes bacterium]|nr:PEP-CTERM sorting domain-containing protein [Planctomycetota bacterium]